MYPGFIPHWMRERHAESRVGYGCGSSGRHARLRPWRYGAAGEEGETPVGFGGGAFGVRRPLRFLAYKLDLEEAQVAELARILDEIKTERAQAAVDQRRALSAFAEAIEGDLFDEAKVASGAATRLQSAERLRGAVTTALSRLHGLLTPDQRKRLAYLIRTGTLTL
jgi:Spy/CpxP family protein refolding chaperone